MNAIPEDPNAGSRKRTARAPRGPESRLFTGAKMARVLHRLGVDFRAFVAEYDQDVSRSLRAAPLSKGERAAIEKFLKHGEIRRLAKELGCSVPSAQSRVTKYALERGRPA